jgi:hypothetical protein
MFAQEAINLLVIDHEALLAKGGFHAPPAVAFELVANAGDRFDDGGVVGRRSGRGVIG